MCQVFCLFSLLVFFPGMMAWNNALYLLDPYRFVDSLKFHCGTVRLQAATRWCYIPESGGQLAVKPARGWLEQLLALRKEHGISRSEKPAAVKEQESTLPEKKREERESAAPAGA